MSNVTKFKQEYVETIYKMKSQGMFNKTICEFWGIRRPTFYEWVKNKPEFREAYYKGMTENNKSRKESNVINIADHRGEQNGN